jgi:hypothetical protein
LVFDHTPELGDEIRYVDPFTGKWMVMKKRKHGTNKKG